MPTSRMSVDSKQPYFTNVQLYLADIRELAQSTAGA